MKFVVALVVVGIVCVAKMEAASVPVATLPLPLDLGAVVSNLVGLVLGLVGAVVCVLLEIVEQVLSGICPTNLVVKFLATCDGNQTQTLFTIVVTLAQGLLGNVNALLTSITSSPAIGGLLSGLLAALTG